MLAGKRSGLKEAHGVGFAVVHGQWAYHGVRRVDIGILVCRTVEFDEDLAIAFRNVSLISSVFHVSVHA